MTYADIKKAILDQADAERARILAGFFKTKPGQYGEGDQFLGLSMPQQHAIAKLYLHCPTEEVENLLHEPFHEMRMVGLLIWVYQARKAGPVQQQVLMEHYLTNRRYVNNWDLVDVTCPHLVGRPMLQNDRSILYDLAREDHLWSQRIAIVSTFTFIRAGQFADTFAIAELLLAHKHDLIHKAVGWMLREVGKRNTEALDEFLHDTVRQIPRTTLRYAIEKFEPARRKYYLTL